MITRPLALLFENSSQMDHDFHTALEAAGIEYLIVEMSATELPALLERSFAGRPLLLCIHRHADSVNDPYGDMRMFHSRYIGPTLVYGPSDGILVDRRDQVYGPSLLHRILPPYDPAMLASLAAGLLQQHQSETESPLPRAAWFMVGLNSIADGLLFLDREYRIQMINNAAERLLEYSIGEVLGRDINEFLVVENIVNAEERVEASDMVEWGDIVGKSGSRFPAELHHRSLFSRAGRAEGYLIVIRDERSKRHMARTIKEVEDQQTLHARIRSEFIANMSHELRTPLNSILGMAELAWEMSDRDDQREFLSILKSSTRNLSRLITTVLDYSRLEARSLTLEYQRFYLSNLIEETISPHVRRAQEKNLRVFLNISPGMVSIYRGDKDRIAQVLDNLLQNAVKFTSSGFISLRVSERDAHEATTLGDIRQPMELIFELEDSGPGIESRYHEKIFEPFFQIDPSATRSYGGTGLGLALARSLARRMGGDVSLTSIPASGSRFTASLIVNREESELLYINRHYLEAGSPVSIVEELAAHFSRVRIILLSENSRWLEGILPWLDFLGLDYRLINNPDDVMTSIGTGGNVAGSEGFHNGRTDSAGSRDRGNVPEHFCCIYDGSLPWLCQALSSCVTQLGDSSVHVVSRPRIAQGQGSAVSGSPACIDDLEAGIRDRLEWLFEPVLIPELVKSLLHLLERSNAASMPGLLAPAGIYLFVQKGGSRAYPVFIEDLVAQLRQRGRVVRVFTELEDISLQLPAIDLIVALDRSIEGAGILDSRERGQQFFQLVDDFRRRTGRLTPLLALIDGYLNPELLGESIKRYQALGIVPLPVKDVSPLILADALDRHWQDGGAGSGGEAEHAADTLHRLRHLALQKSFLELEAMARELQEAYRRDGRIQEANDCFRIALAARRSDQVTVYEILGTMRRAAQLQD